MNQTAPHSPIRQNTLPKGFLYLHEALPQIRTSARYATTDNFVGRPVPGYNAPYVVVTEELAAGLAIAQEKVNKDGFDLVVYDSYRPQMAVDSWVEWALDLNDQRMKEFYYPHIEKAQAFDLGYIAKRSQHTRGAAVDLTLIRKDHAIKASTPIKRTLKNGTHFIFLDDGTLDMFSHFDVFDDASHHETTLIPDEYLKWRNYLRNVMVSAKFNPYKKEWWHYGVQNEPFPETYFNFAVA